MRGDFKTVFLHLLLFASIHHPSNKQAQSQRNSLSKFALRLATVFRARDDRKPLARGKRRAALVTRIIFIASAGHNPRRDLFDNADARQLNITISRFNSPSSKWPICRSSSNLALVGDVMKATLWILRVRAIKICYVIFKRRCLYRPWDSHGVRVSSRRRLVLRLFFMDIAVYGNVSNTFEVMSVQLNKCKFWG